MTHELAHKIAKEEGLNVIQALTYIQRKSPIEYALIGFKDSKQLRRVNNNPNFHICDLWTKEDWNELWKYDTAASDEPYEVETDRFGCWLDCIGWSKWEKDDAKDYFEYYINDLCPRDFEECEDKFAQMRIELDKREALYKKILALSDNEVIITFEDEYFGTFKKLSFDFQTDIWRYAKGVI